MFLQRLPSDAEDRHQTEVSAEEAGYLNLLHVFGPNIIQPWIYCRLFSPNTAFLSHSVSFNRFVWLMEAIKHSDGGERN